MATKILLRRDTSTNWTTANPILGDGEFGYEKNTGKSKVGDGTTAWNDLVYFTPADDDEFYTLLDESTDNNNDDYILMYDISESEYRKISRISFLRNDNVHLVTTIENAKILEDSVENDLIYVPEVDTMYRYITAGSAYTADNKHVLTTYDAGDTRWIAVAGQFMVKNIDLQDGSVYKINNIQVVGPQQSSIADVTGVATGVYGEEEQDLINDLKNKLNSALEALRAHGLIDS